MKKEDILKSLKMKILKSNNKYCQKCVYYEGETYGEVIMFKEKYGFYGCSGIPSSSGDFRLHCFDDKKILTIVEQEERKKLAVLKIIKEKTPEEASEYLLNKWDIL